MNKLKKLIGSTKFYVFLGNPAETSPIEIQLDGNTFYRIELGKKYRIGRFYEMVQFLYKYDAKLASKKGNRFRPYQFFFPKKEALNLLKEGYSVASVESAMTLSYTEDYTNIVSSDGKIFGEGSLPCGLYCIAINEPRLNRTYNEVKAQKEAERQCVMEEEVDSKGGKKTQKVDRKGGQKTREAFSTESEDKQNVAENRNANSSQERSIWGYIFTGAACFLTGVVATTAYFIKD